MSSAGIFCCFSSVLFMRVGERIPLESHVPQRHGVCALEFRQRKQTIPPCWNARRMETHSPAYMLTALLLTEQDCNVSCVHTVLMFVSLECVNKTHRKGANERRRRSRRKTHVKAITMPARWNVIVFSWFSKVIECGHTMWHVLRFSFTHRWS